MFTYITYYRCPLCGINVPKPKTARPKDSQPVDNLVQRLRAKLPYQVDWTSREFKSLDPPKELAAEFYFLFGYGAIVLFLISILWFFSSIFSESKGFVSSIRMLLVLLLILDATVLWNMVISSYASRAIVATVAFCSGWGLIVLGVMVQEAALSGQGSLSNLMVGDIVGAIIWQSVFLLWTSTYLIRAALLDEPKR